MIPPSIIRRVNRVRERVQPDNVPEEILDDVFVLCRAFEATWSNEGGQRQQAEEAVEDTIRKYGLEALLKVRAYVEALRVFQHVSPEVLAQWFDSDYQSPSDTKAQIVSTIRPLREAASNPSLWRSADSRKLGRMIYSMRCAVVHPSLDTNNDLTVTILPALRDALIELTIARAASQYDLSLPEARRQFDAAQ